MWHFRHCGWGLGEWEIETSGPLVGSGVGTVSEVFTGPWQYKGDLTIVRKPVEGEPDLKVPDRLLLQANEGTVTADGKVFHRGLSLPGLSFAVKKSDKPCREDGE